MATGRRKQRARTLLSPIRGEGRRTLLWLLLVALAAFLGLFWLEGLLTEPHGSITVTVRGISGSPQSEDLPVVYRYRVERPDGTNAGVASRQLFQVGSRLRVTQFKSSLSGRSWLRDPVLAP
jgi:hypothetical protein